MWCDYYWCYMMCSHMLDWFYFYSWVNLLLFFQRQFNSFIFSLWAWHVTKMMRLCGYDMKWLLFQFYWLMMFIYINVWFTRDMVYLSLIWRAHYFDLILSFAIYLLNSILSLFFRSLCVCVCVLSISLSVLFFHSLSLSLCVCVSLFLLYLSFFFLSLSVSLSLWNLSI